MRNKLKIILLADIRWNHTVNWANGLSSQGHEVHLISMHTGINKLSNSVKFYKLPFKAPLGYFLNIFAVRKIANRIKPDILNTHYASGYGTLGMLVNYHPTILSVWGSDVFEFPRKSILHKALIKVNLTRADGVFSTSTVMASHVINYFNFKQKVEVTPFGIDIQKFQCKERNGAREKIVLGTVKKLETRYGIDILLRAFGELNMILDGTPEGELIEFLIVGGGSQQNKLEALAKSLGIASKTKFTGYVPHTEIPSYLNQLDIYFALSRSESFGVAVLEASACGLPVIVSNVGGLPEVVEDGVTGYLLDLNETSNIVHKTLELIRDKEKRKILGQNGRNFVREHYSWSSALRIMEKSYIRNINKN